MFQRMKKAFQHSLQEETINERLVRIVPGALSGAFAATVYILTLFMINVLTIPGQHLAIDWVHLLTYWLGFGLSLAFAGAIAGWFTEDYAGIVGGGVIMTVLLLVGNLVISLLNGKNASLLFQSVVTVLPLIGAAILIAGGLRPVIKRHLQNTQNNDPRQRRKLFLNLIGIVFLISLIPGVFSRYDRSVIRVFGNLNNALQNGGKDPLLAQRFSETQLPGLKDHFGTAYKIYPRTSALTAGSMDITVRFNDGYVFSCIVPMDAGEMTYFTSCLEGENIASP